MTMQELGFGCNLSLVIWLGGCLGNPHLFGASTDALDRTKILFRYERYDARLGGMYNYGKNNPDQDDAVMAIFVDSLSRVWVGTAEGLVMYDGQNWSQKIFRAKQMPATISKLRGSDAVGPRRIAEGPGTTIWLAGTYGIWCHRDGVYREISSIHTSTIALATDVKNTLWVVERTRVLKYDGTNWMTVLSPNTGRGISYKSTLLLGVAIATNGCVWIGSTAHQSNLGAGMYKGPAWLPSAPKDEATDGPPMAPLFEWNGTHWRAFGEPHGITSSWILPHLAPDGRLVARGETACYIREGERWKTVGETEVFAGKQWLLKSSGSSRKELLYWHENHFVPVRPFNDRTGGILEVSALGGASVRIAEDAKRNCVWLGCLRGLYRIWFEPTD